MQALLHRFGGERIEVAAGTLRGLAKQPFDATPQTDKNREEQQSLGPAVFTEVRSDEVVTSLELVWQIGNRAGESNDVLADRSETGIEGLRNGLLRDGLLRCCLGLALLFQPVPHFRIGQQRHQLLDFLRGRLALRRCRRFADRGLSGEGASERPDRQDSCRKANRDNTSDGMSDRFVRIHGITSRPDLRVEPYHTLTCAILPARYCDQSSRQPGVDAARTAAVL